MASGQQSQPMVSFQATPFLMVAVAVWVTWRLAIWRRRGGDIVRELGMTVLFGWILIVVSLTFFPFRIVLYDWYGSANFVPFASIVQLITETVPGVAVQNILGNVVLFVPFGLLLPLLFDRMQTLPSLLWRVAVMSVFIESLQVFTRSRAVDVDDVILNTFGGAIGFLLFLGVRILSRRSERVAALTERLRASSEREPLLTGFVPVLATLGIIVPLMLSSINAATLASGSDGVGADAESLWPGSSFVSSTDVGEYRYVLVHEESFDPELLGLVEYERVLGDRYTRTAWGDMILEHDSQFDWTMSAFNTEREELPVVIVWGVNAAGAVSVEIGNIGLQERLALPEGRFFAVGVAYDVEKHQGGSAPSSSTMASTLWRRSRSPM